MSNSEILIVASPPAAGIVSALGALAHEHRLAVFRALVETGPAGLSAGEIAGRVGLPLSSLTFHTQALVRSGLIRQQRSGRQIIFTADFEAMRVLIAFLTQDCCGGAPC
ncbi:MAG: helix-turn-helix domain-containing protein [Alphaproteobacteria bacterium]|nr:helix-turn-helix domain-containing protein [Alphaproteobacteria bacterium]